MNVSPRLAARGLYLITPDTSDTATLVAQVADALRGGPVTLLQYRNKSADTALRREQTRELRGLCAGRGVIFIINDDCDLAGEIEADGVHLGRDDAALQSARNALGATAILGASCYADTQRAEVAARASADYLAFGAMHPSTTKPNAITAPYDVFAAAAPLQRPLVAIGGIQPQHAQALWRAGAQHLALIQAVFGTPSPRQAVQRFHDELKSYEDRYQPRAV